MDQQIQDQTDIRKYFAMIPHMADDDLTIHEYRLYGHYVRVCGQNGGQCIETERTTFKHCKMGQNTFRKARQGLIDKGYITLINEPKPNESGMKGQSARIGLVDLWLKNLSRYNMQNDPNSSQIRIQSDTLPESEHNMNVSNQIPNVSNQIPNVSNQIPNESICAPKKKEKIKTLENKEKDSASDDAAAAPAEQIESEDERSVEIQKALLIIEQKRKEREELLGDAFAVLEDDQETSQPENPSPPNSGSPPAPQADPEAARKQRSKDIAAIIKLHIETGVIDAKPGASFKNKTKRNQAEAILDAGITVEQVGDYITELKREDFWQDKSVSLGHIIKNIKAWADAKQTEADEIWTPPERDDRDLGWTPEELEKAIQFSREMNASLTKKLSMPEIQNAQQ